MYGTIPVMSANYTLCLVNFKIATFTKATSTSKYTGYTVS